MLKTILHLLFEIQKQALVEVEEEIRKEADYVANTLGTGIRQGFEEGFESIRDDFFKLMIAISSVGIGILFFAYGAARLIDSFFPASPGIGFLLIGLTGLILGLFVSVQGK